MILNSMIQNHTMLAKEVKEKFSVLRFMKSTNNELDKKGLLILFSSLIFASVLSLIVFWATGVLSTPNTYSNAPVSLMIIVPIRIITLGIFYLKLRELWLNIGSGRRILNLKNLFSLEFLIIMIGKVYDFALIIVYGDITTINLVAPLITMQIRQLILIINTLPIFSLFLYVVFQWLNKVRPNKIFEDFRLPAVILGVFFAIGLYLTFVVAKSYSELAGLIPLVLLPMMLLGLLSIGLIWSKPGLRSTDFNAPLAFLSFVSYLITQILRPGATIEVVWVFEVLDTLIWILVGLSFYIKPYYAK